MSNRLSPRGFLIDLGHGLQHSGWKGPPEPSAHSGVNAPGQNRLLRTLLSSLFLEASSAGDKLEQPFPMLYNPKNEFLLPYIKPEPPLSIGRLLPLDKTKPNQAKTTPPSRKRMEPAAYRSAAGTHPRPPPRAAR